MAEGKLIWFVVAILAVVAVILGLNGLYPGSLSTDSDRLQLAYGVALLVLLASSLALSSRFELKKTLKMALAWVAIILSLVTVYAFQDGFFTLGREVVAVLDPATPQEEEIGVVKIRASDNNHFVALGLVDGKRVRFMVDTGASAVVLTREDARRVGLDVDELAYTLPVSTANGVTHVAPVRLKSLKVGSIEMRGVEAQVAGDGLDHSLLGMTFLRRLDSFQISGRTMVLRD